MKYSLIQLGVIYALFSSTNSLATTTDYYVTSAPQGFESFITNAIGEITVQLPGETPIKIEAMYRFGEVTITSPQSATAIRHYLRQHSVRMEAIETILDLLQKGVTNSPKCQGDTLTCQIPMADIDFVFDFDSRLLRFFLYPGYFSGHTGSMKYADNINEHLGFINNFNAFSSIWNDQGLSLTIADDAWISLPVGHIRSDVLFHSNDAELYINELSYNGDFAQYTAGIGRFRYGKVINSTAFMDYQTHEDVYAFYFGSSANLAINGSRQYQSLNFYSAQRATLKLLRDGQVILQRNISEGQGSVDYTDLPAGTYDVDVVIEASGQEISRERKSVVNVKRFSLLKGGIDYYIKGGTFISSQQEKQDNFVSLDGEAFIKSAITYRPFEPIMLGGELMTSVGDYSIKSGVVGYINADTNLQVVNSYFSSRSNYLQLIANHKTVTLDYRDYNYYQDELNKIPDLAAYQLGQKTYRNLSLSQSFTLGEGAGYFSVYHRDELADDHNTHRNKYTGTTFGYSVPFWWDSSLDLSLNYSVSNSQQDSWQAGISWSIPLGNNVTARTSTLSSRQSTLIRASADKRWEMDPSTRTTLSAGVQNEEHDTKYDASATFDATREWGKTSVYSYADSKGERGITSSLSSTQVSNGSGLYFGSQPSPAYIVATSNLTSSDQYGTLKLEKDNASSYVFPLNAGATLIPIDSYASFYGSVDIKESTFLNEKPSNIDYFSFPGSIYSLTNELYQTNYFIAYLPDTTAADFSCTNNACLNIDEIKEDIYKMQVKSNTPFTLNLNGKQCLTFELGLSRSTNLGKLQCQ
ncbi:TPA: TcfC E-set like domain-containing protein [Vibrio vulnificus]